MLKSELEIYLTPPTDFHVQMEASGCYVLVNGRLLLLQQSEKRADEGLWGVPGGKLESHETPTMAAIRELFEETKILISPLQICPLSSLYMRKPNLDYIFHMFKVNMEKIPDVVLREEHSNYKWCEKKDLEKLALRPGASDAFETFYKLI